MSQEPVTALRALNAKFIHNFVTNDVGAHNVIIHEGFVCIRPDGARVNRKDYLTRWATAFDPAVIIYWDYRDERIDVFGDVGLVYAVNRHIRCHGGAETIGMTAYTDTYLRQDGVWRCICAQLTAVQPEHYPPDNTIVRQYIRGRMQ